MIDKFDFLLTTLFNTHAPTIKKRVTKGPAPWLTDHIRLLQRQRDLAFRRAKRSKSEQDWTLYRRLRNMTQQQIRNSKIRFYYASFSRRLPTRTLWSKLKELGIGKSKCDSQISFELNALNDFFVNIPVDMSGARNYVIELESIPFVAPAHRFNFSYVSEADVRKAIVRMTSGAVGADNIPIRFIKDTLPVTLPIVTFIFNSSLRSGIFPFLWKRAVVCPLLKCSSPKSPSDFRPISILSALSKCLERVVHQQFTSYLDQHNILSRYQSGFRSHHSTTTALLKITDDIRLAMDKKHLTILTLFDFSKAFDCVYHPLLLTKLKMAGFSNGCVSWVNSYLSNRQQLVKSGDVESDWKPVTRGVPQGSVLGPLLFSIYINDVTDNILYSKFHLYADDLQIYYHFPVNDSIHAVSLINLNIVSITRWAQRHGLQLNETKTQTMVLGTPRLLSQIDFPNFPKLRLNNSELNYSDKVKNLGIIFNKSLTWNDTVTATCNRVFACIHSLKRFALFLPFHVKVMLVKTLVLSHFNYCDVVTNDMTCELSDRLQCAQNYCIRFVFNLRRDDHVTPYFEQLSLLKLKYLREYHILVLLHSILSLRTPSYLSEKCIFMSQISFRNTRRGAFLLSIPQHRSAIFSRSFIVTSCRLWNALPDTVKSIETSARFGDVVREGMLRGRW
uniref:Reverse transcriptase domain-containing protein n=2 Tax=Graphocephala atropunctata TaxID=36148 RepID=A0A1B6LTE5_9HEMI